MKRYFFFITVILLLSFNSFAATIDSVVIKGNRRVPTQTLMKYVVKEGSTLDMGAVDKSIKDLFASGLVTDAKVDMQVNDDRLVLVYDITEKPYVNKVYFNGNVEVKSRLLQETIKPMDGQLLDNKKVESNLQLVQEKYADEKFYSAKITAEIEEKGNNTVDVVYSIVEGSQAKIYNIKFVGNKFFTSKELRKEMETKEKGFWSFISGSGKLKKSDLKTDMEKLRAKYLKAGFAKIQIGEPDIKLYNDKKKIDLTIKINEGIRYKVGSIDFTGYQHAKLDELRKVCTLKTGDWFDVEKFQNDVKGLTAVFTEKGYAYANVDPDNYMDDNAQTINIKYNIDENKIQYINRINIRGNSKSRDRVIRREFDIVEGDRYNSKLISDSKQHLEYTDYFDKVTIAEAPAGDGLIDLNTEVNDKMTGMFSIAAGYSTVDRMIGSISLTQKNLFGLGYEVSTKAEFSSKSTDYSVSFFNPWLFDKPYSFSADVFDTKREYDDYDKKSKGFDFGFGHQLIKRRLYASIKYKYEENDITHISDTAADIIKEQGGQTTIISVTPMLKWNSTNHPYLPTRGNQSSIYAKMAGGPLGGDYTFGKYGVDSSQYVPLFWKFTLMAHAESGYLQMYDGKDAPIAERYRLGGMYSIRGYQYSDISPEDANGNRFGGTKYFQNNFEVIFPLVESAQIMGVFFFDQGQVWDTHQGMFSSELAKSYGAGVRWYSPIGPLRFEYGQPINPPDGLARSGRWEFSIGGMI